MALKFSPNGSLDISTDSSELPSQISDKDESSGAMRRCTNLHLDKLGVASTRDGSAKINETPMTDTTPNLIVEQSGKRYTFNGQRIYEDELEIEDLNFKKKIAFFETDETWAGTGGSADISNYKSEEWIGNASQGRKITVAAADSNEAIARSSLTLNLSQFDNLNVSGDNDYICFWTKHTIRSNIDYIIITFSTYPAGNFYNYYIYPTALVSGDSKWTRHKIKKSSFSETGNPSWATINSIGVDVYTNSGGGVSVTFDFMYLLAETLFTDAKWSAIKYNPYNSLKQNIYAVNGYEKKRIEDGVIYEWGNPIPPDAPVISAGVKTGLSGSYNAEYTYARKEGDTIVFETNPSDPADDDVTLANQSLKIEFYLPTDPQYDAVRIYRTDLNGANYYHLQDIDVPTTEYSYTYTYSWESEDGYFTGTGYLLVIDVQYTSAITMIDCDSLSGWSPVENAYIALNTSYVKKGSASIKCMMGSYTPPRAGNSIIQYTKSSGYWDLSDFLNLKIWIYSEVAVDNFYLYFGESTWNEQTTGAFSLSAGWNQKIWDISAITATSKDRVTKFAVRHYSLEFETFIFYLDDIFADISDFQGENMVKLFDWEPAALTSIEFIKNMYHWEPIIIDTNTADSSLGSEVADDLDEPPIGSFVFGPNFGGMCFMLKENLLHYCMEKRPEYWPLSYYLEVCPKDFKLISGTIYDSQIYVGSDDEIYLIQGTSHKSFSPPLAMGAITGTVSQNCFLAIRGYGIFHLGNDGVYCFGNKDENITNEKFKPVFEGITVGSIPGINKSYMSNCWFTYFKNKFYFGYPAGDSEYPDNILVTDLKTLKTVHYDYGQTFPAVGIDYQNNRLLAADTNGYMWEIEDEDSTDDDGTAISWQIETKEYQETLRKYFPRWTRYDVYLNDGATANGYVLLNGTSKQTHPITESRQTRKRLVIGCTGDRVAIRITGTGLVDIFSAELD